MDRRRSRGQTLVEFALVIPIFLSLLMGIADLGRVVWAYNSLASAAREGARFAIVHGGTVNDACPVGPMYAGQPEPSPVPSPSATCGIVLSPSRQAVRDVALAAAIAGGNGTVATVCYGKDCSGDTDASGGTNARGMPVTVGVSSQISLSLAAFFGVSSYTVTASTTMLVNH